MFFTYHKRFQSSLHPGSLGVKKSGYMLSSQFSGHCVNCLLLLLLFLIIFHILFLEKRMRVPECFGELNQGKVFDFFRNRIIQRKSLEINLWHLPRVSIYICQGAPSEVRSTLWALLLEDHSLTNRFFWRKITYASQERLLIVHVYIFYVYIYKKYIHLCFVMSKSYKTFSQCVQCRYTHFHVWLNFRKIIQVQWE